MMNGWAQMKVATVGQSRAEIFFPFVDLALMAIVVMVPNPLAPVDWLLEMQFRFHTHQYFYVFLAFGTLALFLVHGSGVRHHDGHCLGDWHRNRLVSGT